jgi:hypothetical protein
MGNYCSTGDHHCAGGLLWERILLLGADRQSLERGLRTLKIEVEKAASLRNTDLPGFNNVP